MPWNHRLDPQSVAYQIAADTSSTIRVIAGPGTGKSFALKRRVARLIEEEGVDARRILAVTFTNVAAEDMHRELNSLDIQGAEGLRAMTLHALALQLLRRTRVIETTGRIARPLNDFEKDVLIRDMPREFGGVTDVRDMIQDYEGAWARLQPEEPDYAASARDRRFEAALNDWLTFHRAMLIGEVIPIIYRYLRDNPACDELGLYDHVLVDEFQDLNKVEQSVVQLLGENADICIVGDDDQSIYSFKNARPEGIRDFHLEFANTQDHQLLQCRRCPIHVVTAANSLIANNGTRQTRTLAFLNENGDGQIEVIQFATLDDEAQGVAVLVEDLVNNHNVPPGDILVLAQRGRTRGAIGRRIYEAIIERNVPAKSYYTESALTVDAAKERLAFLKLYVDRDDRVSLRWLLGLGSADFRAGAYRRVWEKAVERDITPWQVMERLDNGTERIPHTHHLLTRFKEIQAELLRMEFDGHISDFVGNWLGNEAELDELREVALAACETSANTEELLNEIVSSVTSPDVPEEVADVRIMSLHKSKGLSAPIVIIAGCVEGLLPVEAQGNEMEEQRRLFYVGITRVKADPASGKPGRLYMTNSVRMPINEAYASQIQVQRRSGQHAVLLASRFIREMGNVVPRPRRA